MAKSSNPVRNGVRSLIWLAVIIVALGALLVGGVLFGTATVGPKLGLDLQGGTQIILAPKLAGHKSISSQELNQAVSIIRQRVDASGVSEAQVGTQGGNNIVVSIPGKADKATRDRIEASAKLELRPVLLAGAPTNTFVGQNGKSTPYPTPAPTLRATPTAPPTNGSDANAYITPALKAKYEAFSCKSVAAQAATVQPTNKPLITCQFDNNKPSVKYILGPVEVDGKYISDATAGMVQGQGGTTTGQWAVNLVFQGKGKADFTAVSERLYGLTSPLNQFAFVLDGKVLSAPAMQGIITDGKPQITGNFTQDSAQSLADQLKFGALPVSFVTQSSDTISATLGSTQLLAGLIAGLIGLILVFIYTLFQYRLLGFVTILSLFIAGYLTYMIIAILSWQQGYRLSLAGVAGLIVAIGFTADSFIVYFERIRDELRDGRGLASAVEAGWKRAEHTIYAAKATNLLAAIVLYILAAATVKGFAFTLGVTTVIDVLVVIMFTHPTLQVLARTRFFSSGHPLSGLDPRALGAVYRGAGQFRAPGTASRAKIASSSREAAKRQTIAERKAAELAGADEKQAIDSAPDADSRDTTSVDAGRGTKTTGRNS